MRRTYLVPVLALLFAVLALIPCPAGAAESGGGSVDFSIRFYDKRIYFIETDPIYVQISITNNSSSEPTGLNWRMSGSFRWISISAPCPTGGLIRRIS